MFWHGIFIVAPEALGCHVHGPKSLVLPYFETSMKGVDHTLLVDNFNKKNCLFAS